MGGGESVIVFDCVTEVANGEIDGFRCPARQLVFTLEVKVIGLEAVSAATSQNRGLLLLDRDPNLEQPDSRLLRTFLEAGGPGGLKWRQIS